MEITRELIEKYKDQWVGFGKDEKAVVVVGRTPKEVMEKAEKMGIDPPLLYFVQEIVPFIGVMNGEVCIR